MDELAYAVGLDPIELRLRNYAEQDPTENKPFSSKSLRECYARGAEAFGWKSRNPAARAAMRDGRYLIGMGMASSSLSDQSQQGAARRAHRPRRKRRSCAARASTSEPAPIRPSRRSSPKRSGMPVERVTVELGDSNFPRSAGRRRFAADRERRLGGEGRRAQTRARSLSQLADGRSAASPLHGLAADDFDDRRRAAVRRQESVARRAVRRHRRPQRRHADRR